MLPLRFLIYGGDRVLAEDISADTFERVYRARRRFNRGRASEKTWIYSIALNLLRDHARLRPWHNALSSSAPPGADG